MVKALQAQNDQLNKQLRAAEQQHAVAALTETAGQAGGPGGIPRGKLVDQPTSLFCLKAVIYFL